MDRHPKTNKQKVAINASKVYMTYVMVSIRPIVDVQFLHLIRTPIVENLQSHVYGNLNLPQKESSQLGRVNDVFGSFPRLR